MMNTTLQRSPSASMPLSTRCRIPSDLSANWRLPDGTPVLLRPVLPKDGPSLASFAAALSAASRDARCWMGVDTRRGEPATEPLSGFGELVDLDFDQQVGYVVTVPDEGVDRIIGEACFVVEGNTGCADIAMVLADAWQHQGIGTRVLLAMARAAARRGLRWLRADVAADNLAARQMLQHCGFIGTPHPDQAGRVQLHLLLLPPFPGS